MCRPAVLSPSHSHYHRVVHEVMLRWNFEHLYTGVSCVSPPINLPVTLTTHSFFVEWGIVWIADISKKLTASREHEKRLSSINGRCSHQCHEIWHIFNHTFVGNPSSSAYSGSLEKHSSLYTLALLCICHSSISYPLRNFLQSFMRAISSRYFT